MIPRSVWKLLAGCSFGLGLFGCAASPGPPPPPVVKVKASSAHRRADQLAVACRSQQASIAAEIEAERASCEAALREFDACRASRPEWTSVELASCSFDMATSLANGDVREPATLNDCGSPTTNSASRAGRADCPVPACEAHLDSLEEQVLARHGLSERPNC